MTRSNGAQPPPGPGRHPRPARQWPDVPGLGIRVAVAAITLLVLAPVAGLVAFAMNGSDGLWPHLAAHVLPDALRQTLLLMLGVGALAGSIGVAAAWLVATRDFAGRATLEWMLLLPLAMPTYIVAFAYADLLHPVGPVQTALRALLSLPPGPVLPDIRSLPGAILLLGTVLYPYVYMNARAAFLMRAAPAVEAARSLGAAGPRLFARVALPLARPAIAAGTGLAMMETLGDIGASEFLGVRTLTVAVYDTWVTRGSIEGAAQIALATLAGVAALVGLERHFALRRDRAETETGLPVRRPCRGWCGPAAGLACVLPVAIGFALPALHLAIAAALRIAEFGLPGDLPVWLWNSARLALPAAALTLAAGFLLAFARRHAGGMLATVGLRAATVGYALPGTVLAVGMLAVLGPLGLSGTAAALMLAYLVRFLAIPVGAFESGYARIPAEADDTARSFGAGPLALARRIHLPQLRPSLAAASVLVFIECMKELPATLLMRPLNVETLATHIYGEAARGTYEDGAVAACAIVLAALAPVAMIGMKARAGTRPAMFTATAGGFRQAGA